MGTEIQEATGVVEDVSNASNKEKKPAKLKAAERRCKFTGLKVSSFEAFKESCIGRQEVMKGENLMKVSGCGNCPCGRAIKDGRLTELPKNINLMDE